ncbi:MAG: hypothetical protein U0414_35545 [Polyangiaceae bacterium]
MSRRAALALLPLSMAACSPAFVLRSAELAPEDEFSAQVMFVPVHLGWGDAVVPGTPKRVPPARVFTGGADFNQQNEGDAVFGGVTGLYEFDLRYGLSKRVEIGAFLGLGRVGGEIRAAPLSERVDHPFSIATSYGIAYEALGDGPFIRAGVDISKRWGKFAPFVNAYVSRGFTSRSAHVGDEPCPPEGYPGTVCGIAVDEPQDEFRVSLGAGASIAIEKARVVFGAEPYIPVSIAKLSCDGCGLVRPLWGLYLMAGMQFPQGE